MVGVVCGGEQRSSRSVAQLLPSGVLNDSIIVGNDWSLSVDQARAIAHMAPSLKPLKNAIAGSARGDCLGHNTA
jgi:hypothetical protein